MKRNTPVLSMLASSEEYEDLSPTVPSATDFQNLLLDYNAKSPLACQIKTSKKRTVQSSSSPAIGGVASTTVSTPKHSHQHDTPKSRREKAMSFTEERPILLSTPNRFSTSVLPPLANSLVADDDDDVDLDYVDDVNRFSLTPLISNSAHQSEILSHFSTPNIDTPSLVQHTPSTSTQPPPVLDTAADIVPPFEAEPKIPSEISQTTLENKPADTLDETIISKLSLEELEELEERKLEVLSQGREAREELLLKQNWIVGGLTFALALPLALLDTFAFYMDKWYGLTFVVNGLMVDIYPNIIDIANFYGINQKRQDLMSAIFPMLSFCICFLAIFSLVAYLLYAFSFESKWKHTCRENDKSTLAKIESIQNQINTR